MKSQNSLKLILRNSTTTSGRELEPEKVVRARKEEVDFIRKMGVWQEVDRPSDKPVLKGRWVDINKGDEDHPIYRSRYVGKEIKKGSLKQRCVGGGLLCGYAPSQQFQAVVDVGND